MDLSIFDNDGTLGDVPANSRVVVLRGTTTVSQLFSPNLFDIKGWLKTGLENRGFSVNAVRLSAAGYIGYANNVEIELNVYNNFTAEEARANAIQAIEAITANYGLNKVFSGTTLSVSYDAYVAPAPAGTGTGTGNSTKPTPTPKPSQSPPSSYDQTATAPSGGFLDNLGLGLGVSTPIVLLGGGVLLLLILKK